MTGDIFMESRIPKEVQEALRAKGHKISVRGEMDLYFGGAQGVMVDAKTGKLYGGADPRRDGFARGINRHFRRRGRISLPPRLEISLFYPRLVSKDRQQWILNS